MLKEFILVVDDDPQVTSFLKRYLEKQEYRVFCAANWDEMKAILDREKIDLCVLDIALPGKNGFDITREIRTESNLPILVLSGRDETFDRVIGLEFGADDYMVKPYEPRELLARIRTILRRCKAEGLARRQKNSKSELFQFGNWIINLRERSLTRAGTEDSVPLTTTEFEILNTFVRNPHTVFNRNQLLDEARGRESYVGDRSIDVHIMRLRKKIEPDPSEPMFIKTVHGIGYSFIANISKA